MSAVLLNAYSLQLAHAQIKPGYIVVESEVLDAKTHQEEYAKQAVAFVEKMGGQFMVRGGTSIPTSPEGAAPGECRSSNLKERTRHKPFRILRNSRN